MSDTLQVKVYLTLEIPVGKTAQGELSPNWNEISRDISWGVNYMADTLGWDVIDKEIK